MPYSITGHGRAPIAASHRGNTAKEALKKVRELRAKGCSSVTVKDEKGNLIDEKTLKKAAEAED